VPGVHDRLIGRRHAHDRRQHKQGMIEGDGTVLVVQRVPGVVAIHEHVGARPHFIPDAGAALDLEGARPRPGDRLAGEAGRGEMADGFNDTRLGGFNRGAALGRRCAAP
jgi:hypothetical protein